MKQRNWNYGYFIKGQFFTLRYNFSSAAVKQHIKQSICCRRASSLSTEQVTLHQIEEEFRGSTHFSFAHEDY